MGEKEVFTLTGAERSREENLVNQKFIETWQLDLKGGRKQERNST